MYTHKNCGAQQIDIFYIYDMNCAAQLLAESNAVGVTTVKPFASYGRHMDQKSKIHTIKDKN